MASNVRLTNLQDYKSILPYSSEIFGVYQPMIGWRGKRNIDRFIEKKSFVRSSIKRFSEKEKFTANFRVKTTELPDRLAAFKHVDNFIQELSIFTANQDNNQSHFLNHISKQFNEKFDPNAAHTTFNTDSFDKILGDVSGKLIEKYQRDFAKDPESATHELNTMAKQESIIAGSLLSLFEKKKFDEIDKLLFPNKEFTAPKPMIGNPFESFDPTKQLHNVSLSPIGIVHLFRQYFFELDTFLGTPVGHVWLSPGSSVELIESSTRRTYTERSSEYITESIIKTESSTTDKDEISDAVKDDNETDLKFGANVSAKENWIWGEAAQTVSFDVKTTQKTARENAHKKMREQTAKLATEIRKNFKSTFKTITEVTDLSSKRMLLNNISDKLINYELRRKMRQIAVQVQDIGTYLCWQTYIDNPGENLGLSNLVHIAKKPDGESPKAPDQLEVLQPYKSTVPLIIPYISTGPTTDDGALDEFYIINPKDNNELMEDNGDGDRDDNYFIRRFHDMQIKPERPGYKLHSILVQNNPSVTLHIDLIKGEEKNGKFTVVLNTIHFNDQQNVTVMAEITWAVCDPSESAYISARNKKYESDMETFKSKESELIKTQYIQAARERIKLASNISTRKYEELREEERIIVYRKLIKDLGKNVVSEEKKSSAGDYHIFSELLNSIFDVNKMLYFVAPEWWKTRDISQLNMGSVDPVSGSSQQTMVIPRENFVSWGNPRANNYLITEESSPAKLGSSLGWLLQLDGDNLRNAFLNSPWVKAVIPIRPGKEKEAINWLKHVEGMNGIGEFDIYQGPEPEHKGKTILAVMEELAEKVMEKHAKSFVTKPFPESDETETIDDRNLVSATPVDRVYEHGFYPLQGGFRLDVEKEFQIFDQWIEIVPTDQVVPVEVTYDPLSGRQIINHV